MTPLRYGFRREVTTLSFADAVAAIKDALKKEGFGVLAEFDMQATLREKLGVETPRNLILAACNPALAHKALTAEPDIGLLLPCNVLVREGKNGNVVVAAIDPRPLFELVANSDSDSDSDSDGDISQISLDVEASLRRAIDSIG